MAAVLVDPLQLQNVNAHRAFRFKQFVKLEFKEVGIFEACFHYQSGGRQP